MDPVFVRLEFEAMAPEEQVVRSREFASRMQGRRTVRHFSDRDVDPELIENAILVASRAPSGANQQPWKFVVVRDPALKREIRLAAEEEERLSYGHRMPEEWLEALRPLGTDWHKEFLEIAPALIVVFREDYGLGEDGRRVKHYYVNESAGIASGFLLAALHISGLATLTHTPSPMGFLSKILDRPPNERPFLLIPVGYPADDAMVPNIGKKTLAEVMVIR